MEEFITAAIVALLFYSVLRFFKISWLKQGFPPSFIYLAGVFTWFMALALVAAVVSFFSMVVDLIGSFDIDGLVPLVVILVVLGIAAKLLSDRKEVLDIGHMTPFLRSAILFRPYDARRQALVERNERYQIALEQKAAAERAASGESTEEVLDISEDGAKKPQDTPASRSAAQQVTELDIVKRGEGADLTEIFKSNTAKLPTHPLYQHLSAFRIDPSDKMLSFRIVFPQSATEPELTQERLQRAKQGMYQVFQALAVEQWMKPYLPFFTTVRTTCFRVHKDEFDMTRETAFMSVQMELAQILQSRGKPFQSAEFDRIATITTEG